jgi:DNA-binding MarR family transcriptional regulator
VGLTSGQFSLLMALNRPEPPTISQVSSLLAMDRTTLTAALKPLQRRGLATVAVDGADKRSRRVALTDAGRGLLAAAVPLWEKTHGEVESLVSGPDPDALRAALRALS